MTDDRLACGPTADALFLVRARQLGRSILRRYTRATLQHLIDWYARHGFAVERIEQLEHREITDMVKQLP